MKNFLALLATAASSTDAMKELSAEHEKIQFGIFAARKAKAGYDKINVAIVTIIKDTKHLDAAKIFLKFVKSNVAKSIFEQYGFKIVD